MTESFGARMRRRREEQQIALATIAERTKIKRSLLEALERDDVSHWPSGIFRRAFIRSYAHAVNLDPDDVVREFFEVFPDPEEIVTTAAIAAATDAARGAAPANRLRSLIGSAVGSFSWRRRDADVSIAPRTVAAADQNVSIADVAAPSAGEQGTPDDLVDPAKYLPRGLSQMEKALDLISAAARSAVQQEHHPDFMALAELCTEFARVENPGEVRRLLQQAARVLNAIGVVVWVWDPVTAALKPAVASGYSDTALAYWPKVRRDADNVTALAFRTREACSIEGDSSNALAVPLLAPSGCSGVLAVELQASTGTDSVRAAATIIAAQLSQLVGGAADSDEADVATEQPDRFAPPLFRAGASA